jgi:hypothetical protein
VRELNERMWADGEPIDPSPSVDQALNEGWRLSARAARRAAMSILRHSATRRRLLFTILPAGSAAASAPKRACRPKAILLQLTPRPSYAPSVS